MANLVVLGRSRVVVGRNGQGKTSLLESVYLLNGQTGERSYYAIPTQQQTEHIHYWKSMLDEAGVDSESIPNTWDEFWDFWCEAQPAVRDRPVAVGERHGPERVPACPSHGGPAEDESGDAFGATLAYGGRVGAAGFYGFLTERADGLAVSSVHLSFLSPLQPGRSAAPALAALTRHCIGQLEARLARPARSAGDWSIALPDGCRCELCSSLGAFLADPVRQQLEWPLAQQGRGHIHQRIDASELPVHHETRRSGRPYTLILSKTGELFEREARAVVFTSLEDLAAQDAAEVADWMATAHGLVAAKLSRKQRAELGIA